MADKKLIAYCGLYCGDCFGHKGKLADLARDLRKELRQARFERLARGLSKYFKAFEYYNQTYEVLGAMVRLRCKKACQDGGGPPFCKIRRCIQKKGIAGCWLCADFETCKKLDFLRAVHDDGHIKNLRKINKQGIPAFLRGKKYW